MKILALWKFIFQRGLEQTMNVVNKSLHSMLVKSATWKNNPEKKNSKFEKGWDYNFKQAGQGKHLSESDVKVKTWREEGNQVNI